MKYVGYFYFLIFLIISGCSDDNPLVNCASATAEVATNEWPGQLTDYQTALTDLDETYVLPSDWGSNCDAYVDAWQTIVDEGCYDSGDETPLTQNEIDAFGLLCDINYP